MTTLDYSNSDKTIIREIIEKGMQKIFETSILQTEEIIFKWKDHTTNNREAYNELFKNLHKYDKHLSLRYDNMCDSKYLFVIAGQLMDENITFEDIRQLSQDTQKKITKIYRLYQNEKIRLTSNQNLKK